MTIVDAKEQLANGGTTSVELTEQCLARIDEKDTELHAYLEVFDDVLDQARKADALRADKGEVAPLTGIPIAIKDNIVQKGRNTTAGSKILETYTGTYDATVVGKLKEEGAVLLGRTNLDEFAMGSSTEHSAYGVTKNPHDTSRVPGGSSGGSAVAVASGGALAALGSDTGGSVRQPASFCGVVGFKPTYGSVSRYGLIALGSSLDVIGPLTKTVTDAELLFESLKGKDVMDSTSQVVEQKREVKGPMTFGVPQAFLKEGVDEDVRTCFEKAVATLKDQGHTIKEVDLSHVSHALAVYYVILFAEASANLARFDGVKYGLYKGGETLLDDYTTTRGKGFGEEVRRRILLGTYVLSAGYYDAYYGKAGQVRRAIAKDFENAFTTVDAILTPTTPTPAFPLGEKNDPLSMYLADIFTVPANLTGIPAISVPAGVVEREGKELPVGLQIMGPRGRDDVVLAAGKSFLNE